MNGGTNARLDPLLSLLVRRQAYQPAEDIKHQVIRLLVVGWMEVNKDFSSVDVLRQRIELKYLAEGSPLIIPKQERVSAVVLLGAGDCEERTTLSQRFLPLAPETV